METNAARLEIVRDLLLSKNMHVTMRSSRIPGVHNFSYPGTVPSRCEFESSGTLGCVPREMYWYEANYLDLPAAIDNQIDVIGAIPWYPEL